ncbi:MAG: DNA-3-methyladenine glycosylase 2 family protein [Pedosphaera sp.]|nr:DNA-3-methyladenine glycosylase 2 family protein [Pedosphaera sp.]
MTFSALEFLSKADPALGNLIDRIGPYQLVSETRRSPFESLVRAVAHQQLHGKAAETILCRFIALFPSRRFPKPEDLLTVPDALIRGAGFSGSKVLAIRDIAAKTLDGTVPTSRRIAAMEDSAIIDRLVQCRGVGRWTVEMLLIFKLGRLDILPVDDFGVREGFRVTYGLEKQPKPSELRIYGESWRPFRTVAAWYLWRAADAAKEMRRGSAPRPLDLG